MNGKRVSGRCYPFKLNTLKRHIAMATEFERKKTPIQDRYLF
jgi:hypothetical protein